MPKEPGKWRRIIKTGGREVVLAFVNRFEYENLDFEAGLLLYQGCLKREAPGKGAQSSEKCASP